MKTRYMMAGAALLAMAAPALAQETYTGYFSEGYEYQFRMNPALGNESVKPNFVAMPVLGNLNIAMRGNLHVSDLVYSRDGKTVLFTNPDVSTSKVMKNLSTHNKVGADFNVTLLAGGFKAWGGYNTVSINARGVANVSVPKDFFSLMKNGLTNKTYNITDMRMGMTAFGEIAFGHSRNITSQWRVGGTLKFLLGIADIDARLNSAKMVLGEDNWTIQSNAEINACMKGLEYKLKADKNDPSKQYVDGIKMGDTGLNGFGMALDLGAVYTLNEDWQFSAAVLDFGFLSWGKNALASTNGTKTFETDKYTFSFDDADDNPQSFDNQLDNMQDDLATLYQLEDMGNKGGRTTMLAATINLAARYTFPLYRPLTFGLVNTTHINGQFTWTDFRLSANVAPVKMFSATAALGVGSYGASFGWMLNYHYTGFGLFIGMDNTLGKLSKQGVPLNSNASLNFGMNFLF